MTDRHAARDVPAAVFDGGDELCVQLRLRLATYTQRTREGTLLGQSCESTPAT